LRIHGGKSKKVKFRGELKGLPVSKGGRCIGMNLLAAPGGEKEDKSGDPGVFKYSLTVRRNVNH